MKAHTEAAMSPAGSPLSVCCDPAPSVFPGSFHGNKRRGSTRKRNWRVRRNESGFKESERAGKSVGSPRARAHGVSRAFIYTWVYLCDSAHVCCLVTGRRTNSTELFRNGTVTLLSVFTDTYFLQCAVTWAGGSFRGQGGSDSRCVQAEARVSLWLKSL